MTILLIILFPLILVVIYYLLFFTISYFVNKEAKMWYDFNKSPFNWRDYLD